MPLLHHFHPPFAPVRRWGSFHSAWVNAITQQLNRELLPPDYYAEPQVQLGNQFEIDVATLEREGPLQGGTAGVATAVWAPPQPTRSVPVDFLDWEVFEVQVLQDLGGPQLRAAIELVSPAKKDRPSHREAFAIKCGSYLQRGVSVIVVDVVTERTANMHAEILQRLDVPEEAGGPPRSLYAVAYRTVLRHEQHELEYWLERLSLGAVLPMLPLWLNVDLCVPLSLEDSYVATCESLRIRT